jgi:WD40 repeat protein/uncharacterized caspase-like protein
MPRCKIWFILAGLMSVWLFAGGMRADDSQADPDKRPRLVAQLGHTSGVSSVAFAPDGKQVVTGSYDHTARLWDVQSGKELRAFTGHADGVDSVAFAPDGKQVLTGGGDNTARLWDVQSGKELRTFTGLSSPVTSVTFSPDGKQVLAGGLRNGARLWDVQSGKELRAFTGHDTSVDSVAFSPDGKQVLTGSWDNMARLWDAQSGKELLTFAGHSSEVFSVAFAPNGKYVLTGSGDLLDNTPQDNTARLWDVQTGKELRAFTGHSSAVHSVAFAPDGTQVLTGSGGPMGRGDKTARLWDAQSGKELRAFKGHADRVTSVAFAPDGKQVLTGSADRTARLWDVQSGKELRTFTGHSSAVQSVAFAPDGKQVLTGSGEVLVLSGDHTARLWDVQSGKELRSFTEHSSWVSSVAFAPDGKQVLTGSETARLWDAQSGKELRTFTGHSSGVISVAFAPDGKQVLTGSADFTARLWDVQSGKALRTFTGHSYLVISVAFAPDGKQVLTGSWDKTARLWDVQSGKELRTFTGHSSEVQCVAFAPDGKQVLTGGGDCTTRIWDAATGRQLCALIGGRNGGVAVTPDNYYLASKSALDAVAFCVGNRGFSFDQFDLKFNRPDKVLERIGLAPREMIAAYRHAYQKRLKRMHFTEEMLGDDFHLPEIAIASKPPLSTRDKSIKLKVRASDAKYALDRLNIYINGVPLHGVEGISLRDNKTRKWEQDIEMDLSVGKNTIQLSALNEKGAESLRETLEVVCEAPVVKPDLYVVVVGVSQYQDARFRLTYADKDANDLADYLQSRKENYNRVRLVRLVNEDATRDKILEVKQHLRQSQVDDQVIVFFAGHGLLDDKLDYYFATADMDFNKPSAKGVSYVAIEDLLDGIRARKKLLLMDTCHSGEVDKEDIQVVQSEKQPEGEIKTRAFRSGLTRVAPKLGLGNSYQLLQETFADLRRGTGAVVIASAGGAEYALESPTWKNGVFTHALLRGLKGEADGDRYGRVRVSKLRDFVEQEVRRLTAGQQAPTARRENLELDFTID